MTESAKVCNLYGLVFPSHLFYSGCVWIFDLVKKREKEKENKKVTEFNDSE